MCRAFIVSRKRVSRCEDLGCERFSGLLGQARADQPRGDGLGAGAHSAAPDAATASGSKDLCECTSNTSSSRERSRGVSFILTRWRGLRLSVAALRCQVRGHAHGLHGPGCRPVGRGICMDLTPIPYAVKENEGINMSNFV